MTTISTRRALEVCMSRLPMHIHMRDWFARNLTSAIQSGDLPVMDIDARRATLARVLHELEDINDSFSKSQMNERIHNAARTIRELLEEVDPAQVRVIAARETKGKD